MLRAPTESDLSWMYALNCACVPEVGEVDEQQFADLVALATFTRIAEADDGTGIGFIVCFEPASAYDSPNYRYFETRAEPHLYNDRIAIASGHRGRGVGRALYEATFARARELGLGEVTCEVNVKPPNPASLAMHERLGFLPLEDRTDPRNGKVVRMLARPV